MIRDRSSLPTRLPAWLAELGSRGPRGVLAWQALANAIGNFLPLSVAALYLVGPAGLPRAQAMACITAVAVGSIAATVPMGRAIRILGARRFAISSAATRALLLAVLPAMSGFGPIALVMFLIGAAGAGAISVFQIIIADALGEAARLEAVAIRKTLSNVGYTLCAAITAAVVESGGRAAYVVAFATGGTAFAIAAILAARLPAGSRRTTLEARPSPLIAVRDTRYMSLVVLASVFASSMGLLTIAIPLWVVTRTSAPPWSVGLLMAVNTLLVVVLQVRVSRGTADLSGARRAVIRGGVLLAASTAAYAYSARLGPAAAVALLVVATAAASLAEMLDQAAWWTISYATAPSAHREEYLAAFDLSLPVAGLSGPTIMVVIVSAGTVGWLGYGAVLVVSALVAAAVLSTTQGDVSTQRASTSANLP